LNKYLGKTLEEKMKKTMLSLVLLATMLMSTSSHAIVSATNGSRALALTGLVMMDLSQVVVVRRSFGYTVVRVITYPALLVAGLVLLDDEGRYDISSEISEKTAAKAGLTNAEKYAIEDNSEEINVLFDEISLEVEEFEGTKEQKVELAKTLWKDYSANLDENVMSGLVKVFNIQ
jgi:hypothetical protein